MGKFRGEDTAELVNTGFNLPSCQHFQNIKILVQINTLPSSTILVPSRNTLLLRQSEGRVLLHDFKPP